MERSKFRIFKCSYFFPLSSNIFSVKNSNILLISITEGGGLWNYTGWTGYTYLYICISVYLYICISVYLYICISVYLYICIFVYLYICISVYLYICIFIFIYKEYILVSSWKGSCPIEHGMDGARNFRSHKRSDESMIFINWRYRTFFFKGLHSYILDTRNSRILLYVKTCKIEFFID